MAMSIITREKKQIKWVGLPTNARQELDALQVCFIYVLHTHWCLTHSLVHVERWMGADGWIGLDWIGLPWINQFFSSFMSQAERMTRMECVRRKKNDCRELIAQVWQQSFPSWISPYFVLISYNITYHRPDNNNNNNNNNDDDNDIHIYFTMDQYYAAFRLQEPTR